MSPSVTSHLPQAALPAPTSVHTKETSGHSFPDKTYGDELRLRWPREWPATSKGYSCWDAYDHTERHDSLVHCRNWAWFARHTATGKVHVLSSACKLRWCPVCAHHKATYLTHEISDWMKRLKRAKLLTLTLKHSSAPLPWQITSLYGFFRKLKNSRFFKHAVRGGIWFFQVKRSSERKEWHPHLHILLDSDYMPQDQLSKLWQQITQTSTIVDIRTIYNHRQASQHVARYATRPCTLADLELTEAMDVMQALHGRRIAGKWGSAGKVRLSQTLAADRGDYVSLGSWREVRSQAETDPGAQAILAAWLSGDKLPANVTLGPGHGHLPGGVTFEKSSATPFYSASLFDP